MPSAELILNCLVVSMLIVVNKKNLSPKIGYKEIYIGRPSILGNPFILRSENERDDVIAAYRIYLWQCLKLNNLGRTWDSKSHADVRTIAQEFGLKIADKWVSIASGEVVAELNRLAMQSLIQNIALVCYCSPKACHGDVIVKCVNWLNQEKE